ncbi:MAG: dockerin type I repeat-containing protein, partial [Phycisphaerales bacterium]|nr:dockerin type I repeat-containing protein [Phycisphaerales bacterium]
FTEFTPEELEVLPNPNLRLKYFWERNAYSDDPFTPEIEPAVPFTIGLMMLNDGFGVANNVRIATSQPEIVDNRQGLLIDFELIGARVGDEELVSPSLNVNLGDLGPGQISVATWYMITSLQGQFVNYEARFEHLDALGQPRVFNPDLSLIESVEIFECIRPVLSLEPADDRITDFMTNEVFYPDDPHEDTSDPERIDLPDTLHLSDGRVEPVTPVLDASASVLGEGAISVELDMPPGWAYIKLPDPFGGAFRLARATREDGRDLPLVTNAWLTDRTFRDGQSALRNARIHLFDKGGPGRYTLEFAPRDGAPGVSTWRSVASHGGGNDNVSIELFPGGQAVECRVGGVDTLSLDFNTPIDPATVTPGAVTVNAIGLDGVPFEVDTAGLTFTPGATAISAVISFAQPLSTPGVYCITVTGVTDPFGQAITQNRRVALTVLPGDVTGDARVNNTDIGAIASLAGLDSISVGDPRHVRADVNRDGRVDSADVEFVLPRRGANARHIAAPCTESGGELADNTHDGGN